MLSIEAGKILSKSIPRRQIELCTGLSTPDEQANALDVRRGKYYLTNRKILIHTFCTDFPHPVNFLLITLVEKCTQTVLT